MMKKILFLLISLFSVQMAMADWEEIANYTFDDKTLGSEGAHGTDDSNIDGDNCTISYSTIGGTSNEHIKSDGKHYHKMNHNTKAYITITLKNNKRIKVGDKFYATLDIASDAGFSFKTSGTNGSTVSAATAQYERELTGDDINDDGSITIYRYSGTAPYLRTVGIKRDKVEPSVNFNDERIGFNLSDGNHDGQVVIKNSSGAVTYSSSNANVVTVDSSTGALTAVTVGKAVITAEVASDNDYLASSKSYMVYVLSNGDGSLDNPYQPTDVRFIAEDNRGTNEEKWVQGYIVGAYNGSIEDVKIGASSATATIGLANTASETISNNCLTVRFVNSKLAQKYLNLKDNTTMLQQKVFVKGQIGEFTTSEKQVKGLKAVEDFRYGADQLYVTIAPTSYATFSAMRGYALPDGMDAYTVSSYADGKVSLTEIAEKIVPAFTGVILIGASGTLTADETEVSLGSNSMKPNLTATELSQTETIDEIAYTNFILVKDGDTNNVKFAKVDGTSTLAANKAYLQLPTASLSSARELKISFADDETTGIENAVKSEEIKDNSYYDLQGRRVQISNLKSQTSNLKKGLYIVNGKKLVVK